MLVKVSGFEFRVESGADWSCVVEGCVQNLAIHRKSWTAQASTRTTRIMDNGNHLVNSHHLLLPPTEPPNRKKDYLQFGCC